MSTVTTDRRAREQKRVKTTKPRQAEPPAVDTKFRLPEPYRDHVAFPSDPKTERDRWVASAMPLVNRNVRRFLEGLGPRERADSGVDDLLQEAWAELLDRHRYFDPGRGRYTTFAGFVLKNRLSEHRRRCRLVGISKCQAVRIRALPDRDHRDVLRFRFALRPVESLDDPRIVDHRHTPASWPNGPRRPPMPSGCCPGS